MYRCIPYRLIKDEETEEDQSVDFVNKFEVLMVSSPNRHDLVFPKVFVISLFCNCPFSKTHLCVCVVYQGGWEDDETVLEAASREAMEEAGVKGTLRVRFLKTKNIGEVMIYILCLLDFRCVFGHLFQEVPLGVWEFRSKSSCEEDDCFGGCKGYMFSLEVTEELEDWPERENRQRKWVTKHYKYKIQ